MCGRFTLYHTLEEVFAHFGVQEVSFSIEQRYNIAPSQSVAVVIQDAKRRLDGYRWGLVPFWAKDPAIGNRMINARAETLAQKPSFKHTLVRQRCLIPADGFYEWKKAGTQRQPLHIRFRGGELFAFAGLWDEWSSPDGTPLRTCTIITVEPNAFMARIHNRMPAILDQTSQELWLDPSGKDISEILDSFQPPPDEDMEAYEVSMQVNPPGFDNPDCIRPLESGGDPQSEIVFKL